MMNITTAQYYKAPLHNDNNENTSIIITVNDETLYVPLDENNRHYAEIMKQVTEGTLTIEEAE